MMNDKLHRLMLGAALVVGVAVGDVNAQNFSADMDGSIFHDGLPNFRDPIHLTEGEAFFIFDDPPGAGVGGDDLPTFGGIQAYANDRGSFRAHLATPPVKEA